MNDIIAVGLEFMAMAARARQAETNAAILSNRVADLEAQIEKLTPKDKPVEGKES